MSWSIHRTRIAKKAALDVIFDERCIQTEDLIEGDHKVRALNLIEQVIKSQPEGLLATIDAHGGVEISGSHRKYAVSIKVSAE